MGRILPAVGARRREGRDGGTYGHGLLLLAIAFFVGALVLLQLGSLWTMRYSQSQYDWPMATQRFHGLRVLALESRRATEVATLISTYGGQPLVAPALREVPLKSNREMRLEDNMQAGLARSVVASIGPTTSEELRRHGLAPDLEASHGKIGILVREAAERSAGLLRTKRSGGISR